MTQQATLQKALYTIKRMKQLLQDQRNKNFEPIAIIGTSCRFPNAVGKNAYWEMLSQGKNIISNMPERRWQLLEGTPEISLRDQTHPYWGGFLEDIDLFDAYYFGISPREAIRIDPQHRLLLEVAHEAIEDAGLPIDSLAGSNTGVFSSLYVSQLAHLQKMDNEMDALYLPTGNAISIAANRISYLFDLHGPSVIVDSACSSSMTSLYLACLNLQNKACELALVCGAKLNLLPYVNFVLSKAKMLSPDGQCKTFDAEANGYVQGEGVGVIVLKPLSDALKDKDRIYAVITGAAVNQDGRTNGLTAPNGLQQETLLRAAYGAANVEPNDISYVECHGTGTFLGDPIEIQALGEVIGKNRSQVHPCWIGSVKTNIGHLEPAAGIASIIKVALALKNKTIPPHLNFINPNPHIAFEKYQFKIPNEMTAWPKYGSVRVAGLSGFGFGGSNAHIVMRDLTDTEQEQFTINEPICDRQEIFTLSAKNDWALQQLIDRWIEFLAHNQTYPLNQICYNLHLRRQHYSYRLAIVASSLQELQSLLNQLKEKPSPLHSDKLFIGEGKQKNHLRSSIDLFKDLDLKSLALHYIENDNINWKIYEKDRAFEHIEMPLYPWQHKSYWPPLTTKIIANPEVKHPLQGKKIASPLRQKQFEFRVSLELLPDLKDTYNILHAGYYLEMLAFAAFETTGTVTFSIENHQFINPLIVTTHQVVTMSLVLEDKLDGTYLFQFFSNIDQQSDWIEHAKGNLKFNSDQFEQIETIETIKRRCTQQESANILYDKIARMGMPAGETIRWTQQYWLGEQEILCEFHRPISCTSSTLFHLGIHPSVFDAAIQPIFRLLPDTIDKPYIASGAKSFRFLSYNQQPIFLWGRLKQIDENNHKIFGDCRLITAEGNLIAFYENIELTQLDNKLQMDDLLTAKKQLIANLSAVSIDERKQLIAEFLLDQIALIFSIPKNEITLEHTLTDLGIDSLMALVLIRAIEVALEYSYPMHVLLEGPTLKHLTEQLATTVKTNEMTTTDLHSTEHKWIPYRHQTKETKIKVFCCPSGGGGASIYRDWQRTFSQNIGICPIQLPGREERMGEKPIDTINQLINTLVDNLAEDMNEPFALFGHSFGSLIAFELTRYLRRNNLPQPCHLFVSAFPDPRVPTISLDRLVKQLKTKGLQLNDISESHRIENLTTVQLQAIASIFNENGIMGYGEYLLDKVIMKSLLPIFVGDMKIVKSYTYYQDAALDIPITVFAGRKDLWVSYEDHLPWREHTTASCEIVEFDSGHMFIREQEFKNKIITRINTLLLNYLEEKVIA
jgi:surfactin synthase thioesterase subunit/3-oxoacyl-(acyl-carrier-protein) synthase/acyl carrier protein